MPTDKKQEKQRDEQKPAARQITFTVPDFSWDTGPKFQFKLILLAMAVLIFAFALFLFTRTNFSSSDVVDFQRVQYNLPKLWGVYFILFGVLYSIVLALLLHYGYQTAKVQAIAPLIVLFFVAAIVGILNPPFATAFYGFALAAGVVAIEGAFARELNLSTFWAATSRAMMVLLIFAFVFSFLRFSANQQAYENTMIGSVSSTIPSILGASAPGLATQALSLCASAIDSAPINQSIISSSMSQAAFSSALAATNDPLYTALPSSTQQEIASAAYQAAVSQAAAAAGRLKSSLSDGIRAANASQYISPQSLSGSITPYEISAEIKSVPEMQQIFSLFPLMAALGVVSVAWVLSVFVHVLSTLFAYGLKNLLD